MSNTFTSRDTWGILKLSETIYHSHVPSTNSISYIYPRKNKDRAFEKAFLVTHADIFNVFSKDDAYDDIFEKVWEKAFSK